MVHGLKGMHAYVVGLTGGMGSGKSTVASLFAGYGVTIVDTDIIARELTSAEGIAIPALRSAFGDIAFLEEGSLNRVYMRQLIFSDKIAKASLEKILHPLIVSASRTALENATSTCYTLLIVPLLFEHYSDYSDLVHRTLLIDCDESLQIQRIQERDQYTNKAIHAMLASQYSREQRRRYASDIIVNNGDIESLTQQVEDKHRFYMHTLAHAR